MQILLKMNTTKIDLLPVKKYKLFRNYSDRINQFSLYNEN